MTNACNIIIHNTRWSFLLPGNEASFPYGSVGHVASNFNVVNLIFKMLELPAYTLLYKMKCIWLTCHHD